jgi:hypothetical protein
MLADTGGRAMKVRYVREPFSLLYPGRVFHARLAVRAANFRIPGLQALEIDHDGAPVQVEPPFAVEVVEATPEEWAALREAGYKLHGTPPPADPGRAGG